MFTDARGWTRALLDSQNQEGERRKDAPSVNLGISGCGECPSGAWDYDLAGVRRGRWGAEI